uniref:Uncharacterized protein n=1 Tax=Candidozyma auris TaxID=498019 RepID=A0A0L0P2T4_CANAR
MLPPGQTAEQQHPWQLASHSLNKQTIAVRYRNPHVIPFQQCLQNNVPVTRPNSRSSNEVRQEEMRKTRERGRERERESKMRTPIVSDARSGNFKDPSMKSNEINAP